MEHDIGEEHEEELSENSVLSLLNKINDRLTAMSALNDQQMRRFETFEYRITRLEVQIQEKTDALRTDLKEVGRKVTQFDWQNNKMESVLDSIKTDTVFLKQAVEYFRVTPIQGRESGSVADVGLDVSNKLQAILGGVQTLLNSFVSLRSDISALKRNVTKIANSSRVLDTMLPDLLTTKHFHRSLLEFERHSYQPICSIQAVKSSSSLATKSKLPHDCTEVQTLGHTKSGVYRIQPPHAPAPFFVYCDLQTRGGGWTVIQRRGDGTLDFYKGWHDYKYGFGNLGGEFWLGLEKTHLVTNFQVNEILVELEDFALQKAYATYSAFAVGTEVEGYPMSFLGTYDGTAGDSLTYHAGQKFSTFDMDHDNWAEGNCAKSHNGAWWYNGCDTSNLNGRYLNGELPEQYEYQGMYWYEWRGPQYSLKASRMMVRPAHKNATNSKPADLSEYTTQRDEDFFLA